MNRIKKRNIVLVLLLIGFVFVIKYSFLSVTVLSESMKPTLNIGNKVIAINKHISNIKTNDIIIFKNDDDNINFTYLIKRVVAKEYDYVEIKNNKLFVNHKFIKEIGTVNSPEISLLIKENEFFVLGDNVNNSYDSRNYGPISYNQILGKEIYIRK